MTQLISDHVRSECRKHQVEIFPGACAGLWSPRQIGIEAPARLGDGVYDVDLMGAFSYMGGRDCRIYHVAMIGRFCAIATNVQMGHAEHPTDFLAVHPMFQGDPVWCDYVPDFAARNEKALVHSAETWRAKSEQRLGKIVIGNDVWIGEGAFIRRGVEIGDGAIIGARAVVNRDVPPYAIVAGTPAKLIRYRFPPDVIEELLRLEWWRYGLSALEGVNFTNVEMALWRIGENISSGRAQLYQAPVLNVGPESVDVLRFDPETGQFI